MTEHRALKQRVRERMARTGESYVEAHRQVTFRRSSTPQPGTVRGYPAFGAEDHQPSAIARHLLAQAGLEVSEPMACGLGGGIGFLYAVFEYRTVPHPLLTIVAQHHPQPWIEAVAQHLGARLEVTTSSSAKPAIDKLRRVLDGGRAAELTVGRGRLPWHEVGSPEEVGDPYPIAVAGRAGEEFLVDDGTPSPRRISEADLAATWAEHRKGRFRMMTLDLPAGADLPAAVRAAIRTTSAHLTGPVLGHSFDANLGLRGMAKLRDEVRDRSTRTGWSKRFGSPDTFAIAMRRLDECLTFQHTAPGGTRPLYSRFLTEADELLGGGLAEAAELADRSGAAWLAVVDLAREADPSGGDADEVFDALADLVDTAVEAETRLAAQLASV